MRGGTVTVSWVWMVARAAEAHGVPTPALLDEVSFAREQLQDPEGRVPFQQYLALFDLAARRTGVTDFGLQAGTYVRPNLHLTTLLVLNGPTLRAVYERMCLLSRFHWDRSNIRLEEDGNLARIVAVPPRGRPALGFRHFLDSRLSIWVNFGRIAVDDAWRPRAVFSMLDPAAPADKCVEFFGCPVRAGAPHLALEFDRALLDRPTATRYAPLDQAMRDLSRDMLASLGRQHGLAEQTRRAIIQRLGEERPRLGAADLAREAGLSLRTFERHLRAEKTSYTRLLEETRIRLACQYFTVRELPLSSIAALVGYTSQAAFDHAFKRVTETTPRTMRRAMLDARETYLPSPARPHPDEAPPAR